MRSVCIMVLCLSLIGCALDRGVTWSPDGKTGVYQSNLIDLNGKTMAGIGAPSFADGNGVWSADSSSLYYHRLEVSGDQPPTTAIRRWVDGPDADKGLVQPQSLPEIWPRSTIYRWHGGKSEPVVTVWATWFVSLSVSSDQQWLLMEGINMSPGMLLPVMQLQAYQLQTKKLYLLSETAAGPCCFTAPNRVAYVDSQNAGHGANRVCEVTLDESAATVAPAPLLSVLSVSTIAGSANGLMILTDQATFPAEATQPVEQNIYAVQRDGKRFRPLARARSMSLSPDGKKVLYIRASVNGNDELAMMNIDGTQQRPLMDLSPFPGQLPMTPTWHGNDRITFIATHGELYHPDKNQPQKVGDSNGDRMTYDVVDYTIPITGPMQPATTLSRDWSPAGKPSTPLLTAEPRAK